MWGATVRAATDTVGGFFVALIIERMLGVINSVGQNAPDSGSSPVISATLVMQENFYLLVILGIIAAYLARAHVEAKMVNP